MITSVKNPIWANAENTLINVTITTDLTGFDELPFTANPNDPDSIGREIYHNCINEMYGPIAPYISPSPQPPFIPTAEQNKQRAMTLLQQTDWVVLADVDDPNIIPHLLNKSEFINYRADLRKIAVNPTAGDLQWPTKPVEQWSE